MARQIPVASTEHMFSRLIRADIDRLSKAQKRVYAFVESPLSFGVGPCQGCGSFSLQWSEYKGWVRCDDCELDDFPVANGILSSQESLIRAIADGLCVDRVHLPSGRLERFNRLSQRYEVQ